MGSLKRAVQRSLLFALYCARALRHYAFNFSRDFVYRGTDPAKLVHVLGNGPSLDRSLYLVRGGGDIIMVNFSVLSDLFFELKPGRLCLADPCLFGETEHAELEARKEKLLATLERVDWDLEIVIPGTLRRRSGVFELENERVSLRFVNAVSLDFGVTFMRYWLFKQNLSLPSLQNVISLCIYSALQSGYGEIFLHGVDSDSFKNIHISADNEMVMREQHYYGTSERNLHSEGYHGLTTGTLYLRLESEVKVFRSYVDLAGYARHLGVAVVNASPNSMIDAFERYRHPVGDGHGGD